MLIDEAQRMLFARAYRRWSTWTSSDAWPQALGVTKVWDHIRIAEYDFLRAHIAAGGVAMLVGAVPQYGRRRALGRDGRWQVARSVPPKEIWHLFGDFEVGWRDLSWGSRVEKM